MIIIVDRIRFSEIKRRFAIYIDTVQKDLNNIFIRQRFLLAESGFSLLIYHILRFVKFFPLRSMFL